MVYLCFKLFYQSGSNKVMRIWCTAEKGIYFTTHLSQSQVLIIFKIFTNEQMCCAINRRFILRPVEAGNNFSHHSHRLN